MAHRNQGPSKPEGDISRLKTRATNRAATARAAPSDGILIATGTAEAGRVRATIRPAEPSGVVILCEDVSDSHEYS
jgi:Mg-chelatase subunit ChlD